MDTQTVTFVPKEFAEQPAEAQPRVTARRLTFAERCQLAERLGVRHVRPDGTEEYHDRSWSVGRELLRTHVVAVENAPGERAPFPREGTPDQREAWLAEHFADDTLYLIAHEIRQRSRLSVAAGN